MTLLESSEVARYYALNEVMTSSYIPDDLISPSSYSIAILSSVSKVSRDESRGSFDGGMKNSTMMEQISAGEL